MVAGGWLIVRDMVPVLEGIQFSLRLALLPASNFSAAPDASDDTAACDDSERDEQMLERGSLSESKVRACWALVRPVRFE